MFPFFSSSLSHERGFVARTSVALLLSHERGLVASTRPYATWAGPSTCVRIRTYVQVLMRPGTALLSQPKIRVPRYAHTCIELTIVGSTWPSGGGFWKAASKVAWGRRPSGASVQPIHSTAAATATTPTTFCSVDVVN